jgi:hypothetical protein
MTLPRRGGTAIAGWVCAESSHQGTSMCLDDRATV